MHKGEFYVLNVAFYKIVDEEGHFHNVPLDATLLLYIRHSGSIIRLTNNILKTFISKCQKNNNSKVVFRSLVCFFFFIIISTQLKKKLE